MSSIFRISIFCLSLSSSAISASLQTSEAGNVYVGGDEVHVTTPVVADLLAAGGHISVEREVGADAAVAGGSITIRAPVGQDLRVAGGNVDIEGNTGGELVAAGGKITVRNAATIAGSAWVAGSNVTIAGKVGKGARIYANHVTISGEINGDTHLSGRQITLIPGTKINGNLFYASQNALPQDPSIQVQGTITREPTPLAWNKRHDERGLLSWFHPVFILSMLMAGSLLYALFPNAANRAQQAIRDYPGRSLLLGLALLFTIPPAAILCIVTVIGIPIGFSLLLLYPLSLMLSYLVTAFFIGGKIAAVAKQPEPVTWKQRTLFLGLALIGLSLAATIPILGGLMVIVALIAGLGGWAVGCTQLIKVYESTAPRPAL